MKIIRALIRRIREQLSPLGNGTPVPEEATLPSGDARVRRRGGR